MMLVSDHKTLYIAAMNPSRQAYLFTLTGILLAGLLLRLAR